MIQWDCERPKGDFETTDDDKLQIDGNGTVRGLLAMHSQRAGEGFLAPLQIIFYAFFYISMNCNCTEINELV